ncbi:MAG: AAA family ATPase [Bacilli bacterium]|jgi:predicted AAA+ superfamily ATPase|nr:AAA family ATPase [Bacilli bacterium]
MYYRRKIDEKLDQWLSKKSKSPALIVGIRQCGKTESVEEFARRNHLQLVEMNFWTNPEYYSDFDGTLEVDALISNISLRFPAMKIDPNNTLLFFDEIQECPRARLSFKNFEKDGRYKVIGSGSYLGINGYIKDDTTPAPTGYDEVLQMKTMDFEEFLWAIGYKKEQVNRLVDLFNKKEPVPENIHNLFKDVFLKYVCIGGFPKVVKEYANTRNLMSAYNILSSTVFDMKTDFGRRKDKNNNPIFKRSEVARIQNVFDLIPTFLAKENKRFIYTKISSGNTYEKKDAIEYLVQAHIVCKVFNLEVPSLPLNGARIESQFKLFPEDIGIVTSMYGVDTIAGINRGDMGQGKGAIFEAAVFDSLNKAGIEPYYFAKESGLEVDFVIPYNGFPTLVEAKAKNGNTKSSKTVMKNSDHYGKTKLIKIGDYNISENGDIITIPHYLTFALGKLEYGL